MLVSYGVVFVVVFMFSRDGNTVSLMPVVVITRGASHDHCPIFCGSDAHERYKQE